MAALQAPGRRVIAGALGGLALLGLCSCSRDSAVVDPTGGPTAATEQTIAPSVAAVDISDPSTVPAGKWASDSPDYVFSDVPQGVQEQWLAQNYPDLWAQGVRAVTTSTWTVPNILPATAGDKGTPGALVAYVGGVKYVGTVDLPLRFQPGVTDGSVFSSVNTDTYVALAKNPQGSIAGVDFGYNSYNVSIVEHDPAVARSGDKNQSFFPTSVQVAYGPSVVGDLIVFDTKDEAVAYVMAGVTPKISGETRVINPGEISSFGLIERNGDVTHSSIFDSRTGGWISIN